MRFLLAILFLLPGAEQALRAQDLTGQWTGSSIDRLSDKKQKLVLNIAAGDSLFGGVLHWYYPETQHFRHFVIRGQFHARDSSLSVREDSLAGDMQGAFPVMGPEETRNFLINRGANPIRATDPGTRQPPTLASMSFHILQYRHTGHKEILEGYWREPGGNAPEKKGELSIRLEKKALPFIPIAIVTHKKTDSVQQKQYTSLLARESPVVATIPVHRQDSIRIDLYDNGEIDGDSVSLFLNNELILEHLNLQAQPKTIWLLLNKSLPVNKLLLYAENLGSIPPNTALMEIITKGRIYNIFLSTHYNRNTMSQFTPIH